MKSYTCILRGNTPVDIGYIEWQFADFVNHSVSSGSTHVRQGAVDLPDEVIVQLHIGTGNVLIRLLHLSFKFTALFQYKFVEHS